MAANDGGKRKGSRKASSKGSSKGSVGRPDGGRSIEGPKLRLSPRVLLLAAGITLAVIAWGYLVYVAIDFGSDARDGDSRAWGFLALAAIGAMACLFAGLMLVARLGRAIGLSSASPAPAPATPDGPDSISSGRLPTASPTASTAPASPAPSSAASHRHRAG